MASEGMPFPWWLSGSTMSGSLELYWEMWPNLLQHVALLLALAFCYTLIVRRFDSESTVQRNVVTGLLFAAIAIIGMQLPFEIEPGVIVDGRTVIVMIAGPFVGILATVIAGALVSIYRMHLGGIGMIAGIGAILTASALGVLFARIWGQDPGHIRATHLLVMGVALVITGLSWTFAIPDLAMALRLVHTFALPVVILFPLATIILGLLLAQEARRESTENALREAQKQAALSRLTGGIAHEFNNLLQVVVGSLEVIKEEVQDSDKAQQMIELAERSAFKGKDLTEGLLSYVGKHLGRPEVIDVGEFLSDRVDLFEPLLGETIEIETEVADDLWPIKVDRKQLEIAVWNLALNARDSMADGGTITIETANFNIDDALSAKHPYAVTPGDYVKLAVTDTGTGMTPEVRGQVFDPFFTTKEVGEGTGLGLSMVYGFVKQSGGFVDITSAEGRGTTVALYLPRAEANKAHKTV